MKKLLIFLVLLIALGLPFSQAKAISLVDNVACMSDGNCTPCDLLTVAFNFAKFIFVSMAALVLLFILWQSLFLVLNMGNPETVKTAKDKIKNTLIAALIILGAYSMVAFAINVYSSNGFKPFIKDQNLKGWWTGPVCPSGKRPETTQSTGSVTEGCGQDIGVPCNCSNGLNGCHCGGITSAVGQCDDASVELEQLLGCVKRAITGKYPYWDLIITSISDKAGLNKCRSNYSKPPCVHIQKSCHYGGPSANPGGSYAADFRITESSLFPALTDDFKKMVELCGGNYIDESSIAGVDPHFHISKGCSGK